jgi:hypothetical protein
MFSSSAFAGKERAPLFETLVTTTLPCEPEAEETFYLNRP